MRPAPPAIALKEIPERVADDDVIALTAADVFNDVGRKREGEVGINDLGAGKGQDTRVAEVNRELGRFCQREIERVDTATRPFNNGVRAQGSVRIEDVAIVAVTALEGVVAGLADQSV